MNSNDIFLNNCWKKNTECLAEFSRKSSTFQWVVSAIKVSNFPKRKILKQSLLFKKKIEARKFISTTLIWGRGRGGSKQERSMLC